MKFGNYELYGHIKIVPVSKRLMTQARVERLLEAIFKGDKDIIGEISANK